MPIKAIVRRLGISRNAVRRALASSEPPRYERVARGSRVDAVEPQIRVLLRDTPTMPATVIAERIGWEYGLTVLKERVAVLRPFYLPPDPASRTSYDPGDRVQCDLWEPPVDIPLGWGQVVFTAGYSRMRWATMVCSKQAPDLIAGHWRLLELMSACPREFVWDNEGAVGGWRRGKPTLTPAFEAFRGSVGARFHLCRPRDPEAKGLTERNNGYLETSFLPGRSFDGPADFNTQLGGWLQTANARHSRRIECAPSARWAADQAAMLTLPPTPAGLGWCSRVRLPRDYYVRVASNDYSVDPAMIGRLVDVTATLERVTIRWQGTIVGDHDRCWARHQTITDPEHRRRGFELAHAHRQPAAERIDMVTGEVHGPDLGVYDRFWGLDIILGAGR